MGRRTSRRDDTQLLLTLHALNATSSTKWYEALHPDDVDGEVTAIVMITGPKRTFAASEQAFFKFFQISTSCIELERPLDVVYDAGNV